jgi:hypothetical protein
MKLYADLPARRTRQLLADLLVLLWVALWVRVGMSVHDTTLALAAPGHRLDEAGSGMAGNLADAGDRLGEVPLVGDEVASPFERAAEASRGVASAGREMVTVVEDLALWLGVVTALVPILLVLMVHLPVRWRFARRATAGARLVAAGRDLDLFALRALATQPVHVLARVADDPAGAWRAGDAEVVSRLADLELRAVGLRPRR